MKRKIGPRGRSGGEPAGEGNDRASSKGRAKHAASAKGAAGGAGRAKGRRQPGVCPYCGHEEFDQLVVEQRVVGVTVSTQELDHARCGRCEKLFNWKTGAPHQENVDRMTIAAVAFLAALVLLYLLTRRH